MLAHTSSLFSLSYLVCLLLWYLGRVSSFCYFIVMIKPFVNVVVGLINLPGFRQSLRNIFRECEGGFEVWIKKSFIKEGADVDRRGGAEH